MRRGNPITLAMIAACAAIAAAAAARDQRPPKQVLLDIPYVSQSEALCGGAAAAMILRYWGEKRIYAEDFAPLLDPEGGGISTDRLVADLRRRGWTVIPLQASASLGREQLRKGRPLLTLVEDRPGFFHYLVLVGWIGDRAIIHDPARAPYRILSEEQLSRAWSKTGYWAALILPSPGSDREDSPHRDRPSMLEPSREDLSLDAGCAPLVAQGIRRARQAQLAEAEPLLGAATELCPDSPAPWRELAGLRLLEERWSEAAALAKKATDIDRNDQHAWRLLGTSRFLAGDADRALEAFNRIGEPRIDLVRIDGLRETRYQVFASRMALAPGLLLTAGDLRRARRRLLDSPTVLAARVGYRPEADGLARVDAAVLERSRFLSGWLDVSTMALRSLTEREVTLRLASPSGGGELWSAGWRWWRHRPRARIALEVPGLGPLGGAWQVVGEWEKESFVARGSSGNGMAVEERRRASLSRTDWITGDLSWRMEVGLDDWSTFGKRGFTGAGVGVRLAGDRLALRLRGDYWPSWGTRDFSTEQIDASWRSSAPLEGWRWTARAGWRAAMGPAPRMLWPGGDTGHARDVLLRAHPLLRDGVISGGVFGRRLGYAGFELQHWLETAGPIRWGLVLFADAARAAGHSEMRKPRATAQLDLGTGVRLDLPGQKGFFRIDLGRGMRDGEMALSASWGKSWPGWD